MVEEYMGFEQYEFIKDNVALFEQGETAKLQQQIQASMQAEQAQPGMDEMMLAGQEQQLEGQVAQMPSEAPPVA